MGCDVGVGVGVDVEGLVLTLALEEEEPDDEDDESPAGIELEELETWRDETVWEDDDLEAELMTVTVEYG